MDDFKEMPKLVSPLPSPPPAPPAATDAPAPAPVRERAAPGGPLRRAVTDQCSTRVQLKEFAVNSKRLLAKCTKPDRKGAPARARARALWPVGCSCPSRVDPDHRCCRRRRVPQDGHRHGCRLRHHGAWQAEPSSARLRSRGAAARLTRTRFRRAQGFIGFFVKLIHIPINNIIVG